MVEDKESFGAYLFIQLDPKIEIAEEAIDFFQKLLDREEIKDWNFVEVKFEESE